MMICINIWKMYLDFTGVFFWSIEEKKNRGTKKMTTRFPHQCDIKCMSGIGVVDQGFVDRYPFFFWRVHFFANTEIAKQKVCTENP